MSRVPFFLLLPSSSSSSFILIVSILHHSLAKCFSASSSRALINSRRCIDLLYAAHFAAEKGKPDHVTHALHKQGLREARNRRLFTLPSSSPFASLFLPHCENNNAHREQVHHLHPPSSSLLSSRNCFRDAQIDRGERKRCLRQMLPTAAAAAQPSVSCVLCTFNSIDTHTQLDENVALFVNFNFTLIIQCHFAISAAVSYQCL